MKLLILSILVTLQSIVTFGQARLIINNTSERNLTIKVMKKAGKAGQLHKQVVISPRSQTTVYFSETGYYFTKSKAEKRSVDPIYKKGNSFEVYNGEDGYSVLTLTYSIKESNVPDPTGGRQISKQEFEKDG